MPRKQGLEHGRRVEAIIKDIAHNCNTKILDYCQESFKLRPHINNISLSGFTRKLSDDLALDKAIDDGVSVIVAGGNSGKNARHRRTLSGMNTGISVGALHYKLKLKDRITLKLKDIFLAGYSSRGKWLDIMSFSGHVDILNPKKRLFGTSFATPVVSAMLALYFERYYELYKSYPSPKYVKNLLINNAIDLRAKGHDYETGHGLFVLPDIKNIEKEEVVEVTNFEWSKDALEWSTENKISDNTRLEENITRREVITLLYRTAMWVLKKK